MLLPIGLLVLFATPHSSPGAQRQELSVPSLSGEERVAHARGWWEGARDDFVLRFEGRDWQRHVDVAAVVDRAMARVRDRDALESGLTPATRIRVADRVIEEWGGFFDPKFLGGRAVEDGVEVGLHELFGDPWTIWLGYRTDRARWVVTDARDESSDWTLTGAVAGALVAALPRDVRVSDADRADSLLARARAALRNLEADAVERTLSGLATLGIDDRQRAAGRGLSAGANAWRLGVGDLLRELDAIRGEPAGERAVALALVDMGHHEAARATLEWRAEHRPFDVLALCALGDVLAAAGDVERAISIVHRAGGLTDWDSTSLLALDSVAGEAVEDFVFERFRASDRAHELFEPLVHDWLEKRRTAAAERLIEIRRATAPDDPNVAYYRASILHSRGEHAQAAMALFLAFPEAEQTHELEFFHEAFVRAMDAAGRGLDGYRAAARSESAFDVLAGAHMLRADWPALFALCDEHEREGGEPGPDLDLWRARAWSALGEHERVIPLARAARERARIAQYEDIAAECDAALLDALWALGGWERAYRELDTSSRAFRPVANRISAERRPADLTALLALHAKRSFHRLGPGETAFWECEVLFLGDDAKAALAEYDRRRDEIWAAEFDDAPDAWQFRVLKLCVRAGDLDRAQALASDFAERTGEPYGLALVALVRGDAATARALLQQCLDRDWTVRELASDHDVARLLTAPAVADVRRWLESLVDGE